MRYLLDTCVISDFIKGEAGTKVRLKQTPPANIAISAITVMELRYRLVLNPQRAQKVEPAISLYPHAVSWLNRFRILKTSYSSLPIFRISKIFEVEY
jgi:tRNA(fMet)-specific endonuclease VapC